MNKLGTLRIPLADSLPVIAMESLLQIFRESYFMYIYLNEAEKSSSDSIFPEEFNINPNQQLYISALEIGTPNFIEYLGELEALTKVAGFFAATLGLPKAIYDIVYLPGKRKLEKLQTEKMELEMEKLRLELKHLKEESKKNNRTETSEISSVELTNGNYAELAEMLFKEGKISQEALNHKKESYNYYFNAGKEIFESYSRTDELPILTSYNI